MWTTGHLLTAARAGGTTQRPPRQQWLFSCLPSRLQSASWLHAVPENSDCKRERKGDSAFRAADAIATKPILCATHRIAECCARRARNRNAPIGTEAFYAAGSGAFPAAEAIATKPILCAVRNFASIADSVTITIALETIGLERAVVTSITQAVTITIAGAQADAAVGICVALNDDAAVLVLVVVLRKFTKGSLGIDTTPNRKCKQRFEHARIQRKRCPCFLADCSK